MHQHLRALWSPHSRWDVQIEVVLGPASDSIASLAARGMRFDLAFLDADKTGYMGYYKQVGLLQQSHAL